jgi:DNA-binding NtrC family response regulator
LAYHGAAAFATQETMVLNRMPILIVEDDEALALELAAAAKRLGAEVLGPIADIDEATSLLERATVKAAIVNLLLVERDLTPVAASLIARSIPVVIYSDLDIPGSFVTPTVPLAVVPRTAPAEHVVSQLAALVARSSSANESRAAYPGDDSPAPGNSEHHDDLISALTTALELNFGTEALSVAERQMRSAIGISRNAWAAAIQRLSSAQQNR